MAPKADLGRAQSAVHAFDQKGQVFQGLSVWTDKAPAVVADPDSCFAKCAVLSSQGGNTLRCRQIEPRDDSNTIFEVKIDRCYNVNPSNIDPMNYHDIGALPHTNEAAVLDFLRTRYVNGQIYTTAHPLLVALNPFKDLKNATAADIERYRDANDVDRLPPHVFTIARQALDNLHSVKKSQTIIVSGESGAGKTEATKQVMRYFAAAKGRSTENSRIQEAVLAANPVLEAFGNAKTVRNNNSSRFGRFMQLQVARGGGIEYGRIRNFLLEKSRLLTQDAEERSYHIFYQLIKGADSELRRALKLKQLTEYKYINPKCSDAPGIDDLAEWRDVLRSFESIGLSPEERHSVFSIVAGVLLLGNVEIDGEAKQGLPDAAMLTAPNRALLQDACDLLFLDTAAVEEGLLVKITTAGKQQIRGAWTRGETQILKDSLAKGMYDKLFDWIVHQVNARIKPEEDFKVFMAMLDIFGFEVFKNNSLEQLFINITNEMLQKNFTDAVFDRETKLYRQEGISSADLVWTTNQEVIDMLTAKKKSLMTCLEDQCIAPKGTDTQFLSTTYKALAEFSQFKKAKVSSDRNFVVAHTIGDIAYNVTGFLFKNNDVLRGELVEVIQKSHNPVALGCFEHVEVSKGKLAKGQLIGSQFMNQLGSLMDLINITEPHFIRCVKPNECKTALKFVSSRVLVQLHSLSILEALQLKNLGYSYRRPFEEFVDQYCYIDMGVAKHPTMAPKEKALGLVKSAGIGKEGWQCGHTMIFMKQSAMKEMSFKYKECLALWGPLVTILEAMVVRMNLRRTFETKTAKPIIRLQALARRKLNGKVAAPPYNRNITGWAV